MTYNAIRIIHGEIPYRDFFLTTTPGTYYVQAFSMHIFGTYLILSRILYIAIILGILLLISRLFIIKTYIKTILLVLFAFMFVSPAYAFYNIEGVILYLVSFYLLKKSQSKQSTYPYMLIGLLCAIIFFIKQSYGVANIIAVIASIYFLQNKIAWLKYIIIFLISFTLTIFLYVLYLIFNNALGAFVYYVFIFSRDVKSHRIPFIITTVCIIPVYFFIFQISKRFNLRQKIYTLTAFLSLSFLAYLIISPSRIGRLFTIIHDPLIYYYLALLIVPLTAVCLYWKSSKDREIVSLSFFSLGLFLASASSGRDYTTVLMVSPFFLPLCVVIVQKSKISRYSNLLIGVILLIYAFPLLTSITNMLQSVGTNNSYISNVQEAGNIRIPKDQADELSGVISYIRNNVDKKDKILCYPYCPLIFILSNRDSASYFSFFYPETFRITDQKRVIQDTLSNKAKIIILQRKGSIEQEAYYENKRLNLLKDYFTSHYQLVKQTSNFSIYKMANY